MWYVIRILENLAEELFAHLSLRGVEVYAPRFTKFVRTGKRRKRTPIQVPVFSGYAFVHIRDLRDFRFINSLRSCLGFLPLSGSREPAPLAPQAVRTLREQVATLSDAQPTTFEHLLGKLFVVDVLGRKMTGVLEKCNGELFSVRVSDRVIVDRNAALCEPCTAGSGLAAA